MMNDATIFHWCKDRFNFGRRPPLRQRPRPFRRVVWSRRHRRIHHVIQSVSNSPGTRENSRRFAVTRVAPRRRAWAAMRQS